MVKQTKKNKQYVLGMFPYPSGEGLHVGHVRIYTAVDVMARYFRMQGQDVLDPIGWDAFGLPAENAAIKNKKSPQDIVPKNYNNFRAQMKNLNFSFDWERELATTDPSYYGLTQWIFLELYKKGMVYREQVPINWCPKCKTGLANEEVLSDGTHERCGTVVGKKNLPQWVMKITAYADRLLKDLDQPQQGLGGKSLDWPRGILEMQRNWIGKKAGINIDFEVVGYDEKITVFTTTPVNFGATFLVLAPEHDVVSKVIKGEYLVDKNIQAEVTKYLEQTQQKSEVDRMVEGKEKTGVFTGLYVKNHLTNEDIPVWISDFVLINVGTGAVQGCPAHDERDFEFAKKFGLPIIRVVEGENGESAKIVDPTKESVDPVKADKGVTRKMVNSEMFNGLPFDVAMEQTKDYFEKNRWGARTVSYHLRDWVFSRQRYWGEPIPLVYCDKCGDENGVVPLTETDLPLELPYLESYEPTDTGESPLVRVTAWVQTICPNCGGPARRETDTMPNWAGSCWYHLAFAFWNSETKTKLGEYKKKSKTPFSDFWKGYARPEIDKWLPVDWYLGGAEHAVLHLLYARFWMKVLQELGHVGFSEPYLRLRSVGMVLAEDGRKMSKSWGNVINPDDMVKQFGSDPVRLYEMFMGPWDQAIAWDTRALVGMRRFVERITEAFGDTRRFGTSTSPLLAAQLAKLISQVERGIIDQKFNTAIAGCMEFLNAWRNSDLVLSQKHAQHFAHILSPFAPSTAQKGWELAAGKGDVATQAWPQMDAEAVEVLVTIAIQINGKLRSTIIVDSKQSKDEKAVLQFVMQDAKVRQWVTTEPKKTIFVPGKLVNIVV